MIEKTIVSFKGTESRVKLDTLQQGAWFSYDGLCYIKMHERYGQNVNCFSLAINEIISININTEVIPYKKVDITFTPILNIISDKR